MYPRRTVDFSGGSRAGGTANSPTTGEDKKALIERTRAEREARALAAHQTSRAVVLQRAIRRWLVLQRARRNLRRVYDARWQEYTTLLASRTAAVKENPMFDASLFIDESIKLERLVALWELTTRREEARARVRPLLTRAADDLRLLSLAAAIVKSAMAAGSERHNFFHGATREQQSSAPSGVRWLNCAESLVRMILARLVRDSSASSNGGPAIKDAKSFALLAGCLCLLLDPARWNVSVGTSATPTVASSSTSADPAAQFAPAIRSTYAELLHRLMRRQNLFTSFQRLLFNLCFPPAPTQQSPSASALPAASSAPATAAATFVRPTALITAILTACFRIVEIVVLIPPTDSSAHHLEAIDLFTVHILTFPSLTTLLTPAHVAILTKATPADTFYDAIYASLHRLLSSNGACTVPRHLFPTWLRRLEYDRFIASTVPFDRADLHFSIPAPIDLLANLLALSSTHFRLVRLDHDQLHAFVSAVSHLLQPCFFVRALLALNDQGQFEFETEEDEADAIQALGGGSAQLVNTPEALICRRELLTSLAIVTRHATLITLVNHIFLIGYTLLEEQGTSLMAEEQWKAHLLSYSVVDAPLSSTEKCLRAFRAFRAKHPEYIVSLLRLVQAMHHLRRGSAYANSKMFRSNALNWLSFGSPLLVGIFDEIEREVGCELSEQGPPTTATAASTAMPPTPSSSSSSVSVMIKAFFGLKSTPATSASSSSHSMAASLVVTNRNQWEALILTARNYDGDDAREQVTVTDHFALWLAFFAPLLFILDDEELLAKLPGFTPGSRVPTLVSLVHLLKMIVFRLLWNKYEAERLMSGEPRVRYEVYADLLFPAQLLLRELYQRDTRRNFMVMRSNNAPISSKQKSAVRNGTYDTLATELETFVSSTGDEVSSVAASAPEVSVEIAAAQWLLWSAGDSASRLEMETFHRTFEAWASGAEQESFDPTSLESRRMFHILTDLPFILAFQRRAQLLRSFIREDSRAFGYRYGPHAQQVAAQEIIVRRQHVVEDSLHAIARLGGRGFKFKTKVRFIDALSGEAEKGIDLGGPFKEMLELVLKEVFNANYGLFARTPTGEFYPSPDAPALHPRTYHSLLLNIGRVCGKALQEGILLDVPFAPFFLNRIIGQPNVVGDLRQLDPELYKNLMFVKNYDGDVADLGLSFTVDTNVLGQAKTVELIDGGASVEVTNANRYAYAHRLANYHLNTRVHRVFQPFLQGFNELVPHQWLTLFNSQELSIILSGDSRVKEIDIGDWRTHTKYEECTANTRVVLWFWELLASSSFTPEEKAQLLKFTTSCSRPPLQGFKELYPPFTIRVIPVAEAASHVSSSSSSSSRSKGSSFFSRLFTSTPSSAQLPSSATCFNTLKLPKYTSKSVLEEKLRLAIAHNTGFHLT